MQSVCVLGDTVKSAARRVPTVGLLVAGACLAYTGVANASIVINQSIDGVALGATMSQVDAKLGKPATIDHFAPNTTTLYFGKNVYTVFFDADKVIGITTTLKSEKTPKGLGPGIKVSTAMQEYPSTFLNLASGGAGPLNYFVSAELTPASPKDASIITPNHKNYNLAKNSVFTMISADGTPEPVISVTVGIWTKASAAACVLGCYG